MDSTEKDTKNFVYQKMAAAYKQISEDTKRLSELEENTTYQDVPVMESLRERIKVNREVCKVLAPLRFL